jgi:hypothetical protein
MNISHRATYKYYISDLETEYSNISKHYSFTFLVNHFSTQQTQLSEDSDYDANKVTDIDCRMGS